jgi:DNA-binding LytR/AlgR family response regulator
MIAINMLADRQPGRGAESPPAAPAPLAERLPFKLRGAAIRAVQAEDHYLRVHTDAGDALILMRLSDALTELRELDGARTHRSWWVARDAVNGVRRGRGRAVLELKGGLEAPVSRSFARSLRDEGWF